MKRFLLFLQLYGDEFLGPVSGETLLAGDFNLCDDLLLLIEERDRSKPADVNWSTDLQLLDTATGKFYDFSARVLLDRDDPFHPSKLQALRTFFSNPAN